VKHKTNDFIEEECNMWVITLYEGSDIKMFEFETEVEAKKVFKNLKGSKILSNVVYYNDPSYQLYVA